MHAKTQNMYWIPMNPKDAAIVAAWFEQKQNFKLPNSTKMKAFLKSLFFDKWLVKNAREHHAGRNELKNHLQQGHISMQEYLYLSR